jgi:hypothetical protein
VWKFEKKGRKRNIKYRIQLKGDDNKVKREKIKADSVYER